MLTLYSSPASPYARMARATLIETGLMAETTVMDVMTSPVATDPRVASANPVGKIPTLLRDEGPALADSRVICRYLDARAKSGLYPESRLWEVLTLEAIAHGITDAAIAMVYETRLRPAEKVHAEWLDAQWAKIARSLDTIEARWSSHLTGKVTIAQIALACALGYLDFRLGDRDWRAGRPDLAAWESAIAKRPSLHGTMPV